MLPLASLLVAAVTPVSVGDNFYDERTVRIQPGDSVTWSFDGALDHTVTATRHQTMRFDSGFRGSGTFTKEFPDPGRFTYFCELHGLGMRGVVEVGGPPFPDTGLPVLTRLRARAGDDRVRLGFRLSERSRVKVTLSGPTRRSVTKRLGKGQRSVAFRRLGVGRYKAMLRPTDAAGNRGGAASRRFRID
jgi:plastocyanin